MHPWYPASAALRTLVLLGALLAGLLLSPGVFRVAGDTSMLATAAAAHAGACARDAACAKLADEARTLSKQGLLDAALISYQRAYALCSDPILLFNLARVYHRLGRREPAVANYKQYLLEAPDDDPAERKRAATFLSELAPDEGNRAATANPEGKSTAGPEASLEVKAAGPPPGEPGLVAPVPAVSAGARRREAGTPVYKKWWLWTAVGLGVAAVATGVALGLAAREPDFGSASQFHPFNP